MTRKYTVGEVTAKAASLSPSPAIIDRRGQQTAEGVVSSLIELTYRSLNSDIDSVYSLIRLFVAEQALLSGEVISKLTEIYDLSPSVTRDPEQLDDRSLDQIKASAETAFFTQGSLRDESLKSLRKQIERLIKTGTSGRSPQYAKSRCLELLLETITLLSSLQHSAANFSKIVEDYMDADFESVLLQSGLDRSNKALSLLGNNMDDPNEAKLALSIIDGMLDKASQSKRDIRAPKFSGRAILLPGKRAAISGCTLPLIVQGDQTRTVLDLDSDAEFTYTDSKQEATVTVGAADSDVPAVQINIPGTEFRRTESGILLAASSTTLTAGPVHISSHDLLEGPAYLSELIHTSSFHYDDAAGTFTTVNSAAFCPFLKTYVAPESVTIRLSVIYLDLDAYNNQPIEFGTLSPSDFSVVEEIVLTDDGTGSLVDSEGFSAGTIDYSKGSLYINTDHDIDRTSDITITYDYLPLYEGRSYVAQSGSTTDSGSFETWDSFSLWLNNNIEQSHVTHIDSAEANSLIETADDLETAFKRVASTTVTNNTFRFMGVRGGSASRLSFPHRDSLSKNAQAFAPVWTSTPEDFNQALGLSSLYKVPAYGKDTQFTGISMSGELVSLRVTRQAVAPRADFTYTSNGQLATTADLSLVNIGDNVHITSPIECHTKVTAVADGYLGVYPDVLLPIEASDSDVLLWTNTVAGTITRNTIQADSVSDDPLAKIVVKSTGLGFSGEGSAQTDRLHLGADVNVSEVVTDFGYTIKPGDVVVEKAGDVTKPIGTVRSIEGNELTIRLLGSEHIYPYEDIEIYALGWSRFKLCAAPVSRLAASLYNQLYENDLLVKGTSYLNSGSGQSAFYQAVLTLRDNTADLRNQYLGYDSHVVNTADGLLSYFRQDKVRAVTDLLEQCRFSEIAEMTPATLVARSSTEQLLSEASNMMGGDMTYWQRGGGPDLSNDYSAESDHPPGITQMAFFEDADEL